LTDNCRSISLRSFNSGLPDTFLETLHVRVCLPDSGEPDAYHVNYRGDTHSLTKKRLTSGHSSVNLPTAQTSWTADDQRLLSVLSSHQRWGVIELFALLFTFGASFLSMARKNQLINRRRFLVTSALTSSGLITANLLSKSGLVQSTAPGWLVVTWVVIRQLFGARAIALPVKS